MQTQPTYLKNPTDKQQNDLEQAADCSAIRFPWFDGKYPQTGVVKAIPAEDLTGKGNTGGKTSDAIRMIQPKGSTIGSGSVIGSHNDKPAVFATPGKK